MQYIMCDHIGIEDKSANSTFHLVSKQGSPTAIHDFAPEPKFQGVINHRYIIFANRKVHVLQKKTVGDADAKVDLIRHVASLNH